MVLVVVVCVVLLSFTHRPLVMKLLLCAPSHITSQSQLPVITSRWPAGCPKQRWAHRHLSEHQTQDITCENTITWTCNFGAFSTRRVAAGRGLTQENSREMQSRALGQDSFLPQWASMGLWLQFLSLTTSHMINLPATVGCWDLLPQYWVMH